MAERTLYNKVWNKHKVATLPTGQDQLFIGLHLIHEVTTPQAFASLHERQSVVRFPKRTFATLDHIIPTENQLNRPFSDQQAELMSKTLEFNVKEHGITFFNSNSGNQGIVHVIGPELGLTKPGMTIACGDSHTSTHGAFGSLGFGIGTSEVALVLETQTLALTPLKVRKIEVAGTLQKGVSAKDVVLKIINECGVKGGIGYAYEFSGSVFEQMSMEERMTVCNMSIEGGARIGYVNPDQTTIDYLVDREYVPQGEAFDELKRYWLSINSDHDAIYDDVVMIDGASIEPMVTWGITPGQSVGINELLPNSQSKPDDERQLIESALEHMQFQPDSAILDKSIDVVFVGSCTNSRLSDLRAAAEVIKNNKVHKDVKMMVVPGSQNVKKEAEKEGLDKVFIEAGADWRDPGCSMCLAMNPDKLENDQLCASTSNRNFIGRQGSPTGRTLLMSPQMAALAAIHGKVKDIREFI
ncbi:MAG: 3-isopropylmalate dehydratase large subunit [Rickettsiales bacterium]|nr:3-isopropylmalate dehydratase large subunit [Rickettsiales bacterium]|tara:strand:- start:5619 stop:7025 length:1407 start_codon:yes stop_codon:yes gene_type:complete